MDTDQVEERLDALESVVDALVIEAAGCESEKWEFGEELKRRVGEMRRKGERRVDKL